MFDFSIRNPIILTVAILVVCLFGLLAVYRVPVQMIPDLDARVITVETRWPGATPQDVEKEIVIEQEDYLMGAHQQRTAESGQVDHLIFGRNEPALHHYHSTYRDALGMKPLPLLAAEEVAAPDATRD